MILSAGDQGLEGLGFRVYHDSVCSVYSPPQVDRILGLYWDNGKMGLGPPLSR